MEIKEVLNKLQMIVDERVRTALSNATNIEIDTVRVRIVAIDADEVMVYGGQYHRYIQDARIHRPDDKVYKRVHLALASQIFGVLKSDWKARNLKPEDALQRML
jgi:hypothetical protein